jgi:N-acetylglucosamine kinase-like BadF-type ATPase
MRLYLAIDGGNSKTDAVIGTEHGDVLAYVRGPGTCHQNIGLPATMTRLSALVAQARAAAALDETLVLERADIFLAGADLPAEIAMLSEAIQAQGWASSLRLSNDAIALLRAGTDAPDAVAVVCGAGSQLRGPPQATAQPAVPLTGAAQRRLGRRRTAGPTGALARGARR